MKSYAKFESPLGAILLEAEADALTGLYFTDQWDCPQVAGMQVSLGPAARPADGEMAGRPIRKFHAVRAVDREPDLFAAAPLAGGGHDAVGGCGALQWPQGLPPAEAQRVFQQVQRELDAYFRGRRREFDVPLDPHGTGFQKDVWRALCSIPCGETVSYAEVARRAGLERRHSRAVGAAVGSNPISILIPCHRVLASNGTLNGYGGGLPRKVRLLQLEGFVVR